MAENAPKPRPQGQSGPLRKKSARTAELVNVSVPESFSYGLGMLKLHAGVLIPGVLAVALVSVVAGVVGSLLGPLAPLVSLVASSYVAANLTQMALDLHDGKAVELSALGKPHPNLVNYMITTLVVGILVGIGSAILLLPGLAAMVLLLFALPLTIEKGHDVGTALKTSVALAKPRAMQLAGFLALAFVANFLGVLLLGIGVIATAPITLMAFVRLYRATGA